MKHKKQTLCIHKQKIPLIFSGIKYIHSAILPFWLIRLDIPPHQQDYPAYHTRLLW